MRRIDFIHTTAVDTSISASEFFPLAMRSFGALLRSIVLDANFLANHVLTNILFHYLVLDALVALLLDALLELLHEALLALFVLVLLTLLLALGCSQVGDVPGRDDEGFSSTFFGFSDGSGSIVDRDGNGDREECQNGEEEDRLEGHVGCENCLARR